jgi:hypothetical protein
MIKEDPRAGKTQTGMSREIINRRIIGVAGIPKRRRMARMTGPERQGYLEKEQAGFIYSDGGILF